MYKSDWRYVLDIENESIVCKATNPKTAENIAEALNNMGEDYNVTE